MHISRHWHDDAQTIMLIRYTGRWDWDQHIAFVDEFAREMRQQYGTSVRAYVIFDLRGVSFPANAMPGRRVQEGQYHVAAATSFVVIVVNNPFMRVVVQTGLRLSNPRGKFHVVASVADAETLIREHRAQIDGAEPVTTPNPDLKNPPTAIE